MGLRSRSCLLLLLVLVPATLISANCAEPPKPCPSEVSCSDCVANDRVPDPDNCRGYYVCDGEGGYISLPFECDPGQVFNATEQQCETGEECEPCPPLTASCVYECQDSFNGSIPTFADCHNFYECTNGIATGSGTCDASTPFFDGEQCQTDESRCCHCHPYCYDEQISLIADPLDCRKYYLCTEHGETPTMSGTCPDGEYFDSFLQGCSATAACLTECTNVVGADGCIDPFTCVSAGYFARCPAQCTPDYYHCMEATGEYQDYVSCGSGTVFHPDSHSCVSSTACP